MCFIKLFSSRNIISFPHLQDKSIYKGYNKPSLTLIGVKGIITSSLYSNLT